MATSNRDAVTSASVITSSDSSIATALLVPAILVSDFVLGPVCLVAQQNQWDSHSCHPAV